MEITSKMSRTKKHRNAKIFCSCIMCCYSRYKAKEKRKHDKIFYDDLLKEEKHIYTNLYFLTNH